MNNYMRASIPLRYAPAPELLLGYRENNYLQYILRHCFYFLTYLVAFVLVAMTEIALNVVCNVLWLKLEWNCLFPLDLPNERVHSSMDEHSTSLGAKKRT